MHELKPTPWLWTGTDPADETTTCHLCGGDIRDNTHHAMSIRGDRAHWYCVERRIWRWLDLVDERRAA